jgi:hypothetical protein
MILKIISFLIVEPFKIKITFNNSETRIVDLAEELDGEVFEPLKDSEFFKRAYLTEWNVIEWPNGADFAPEYLFDRGKRVS